VNRVEASNAAQMRYSTFPLAKRHRFCFSLLLSGDWSKVREYLPSPNLKLCKPATATRKPKGNQYQNATFKNTTNQLRKIFKSPELHAFNRYQIQR